jgi:tetratricopeptide (TPR) repeat protein
MRLGSCPPSLGAAHSRSTSFGEAAPKRTSDHARAEAGELEIGSRVGEVLRRGLLICALLSPGIGLRADSHPATGTQGAGLNAVEKREALQKAALLVQQGRLEEAEKHAELALSSPETRGAAHSVLGAIRFQQQRLDESARLLQEAIRLEPRLLGAHLTLAEVHIAQGQSDPAVALFRRALELDPMNPTARFGLARSEVERGNYQRSLEIARPVLAALKLFPEGLLVLATSFLKTGDRVAALELVDHWARLSEIPQSWSIKFALLFADEGVAAGAIAVLERAQKVGPAIYELAFNLGGAHLLNSDPARALEAYDAALGLRPDSVPALRQAAAIAERQGELERSLSYWIRAKKIEPSDPEILLGFGRVCLKMDLLDDAEPALTSAASQRPGELAYQYALAAAKVGKRQFEAAQGLLEKLVEQRPQDAQLQYGLGSVLYIQGRLGEAAAHLKESVRLQPEHLAARHYLALIARDQGKDAEAIDILERLLQRYPEHASSHEVLGGLLMTAARYPAAEQNLRAAVRLNPKSVKANYQLGLLLARMGRKEEAATQLELTKQLRKEDEATSRLQLRLLEPDR